MGGSRGPLGPLWCTCYACNKTGTQVWAPVLAERFAGVHRVWLVQWADQLSVRPATKTGCEELALVRGMRLGRRWTVHSVVLSLCAGQSRG
jgi:hypothetical protein